MEKASHHSYDCKTFTILTWKWISLGNISDINAPSIWLPFASLHWLLHSLLYSNKCQFLWQKNISSQCCGSLYTFQDIIAAALNIFKRYLSFPVSFICESVWEVSMAIFISFRLCENLLLEYKSKSVGMVSEVGESKTCKLRECYYLNLCILIANSILWWNWLSCFSC